MKISQRRLTNPSFENLIVNGQLLKISLQDGSEKKSSYMTESLSLRLKSEEKMIVIDLSTDLRTIEKVTYNSSGWTYINHQILTLDDLIQSLENIVIPTEWADPDIFFLFYTYFRIVIGIITRNELEQAIIHQDFRRISFILSKQLEYTEILLNCHNSFQVAKLGYVVNDRARNLLMLGLDPKEKYSFQHIKKESKRMMKTVHPDTEIGNENLFKRINLAMSYFK